MAGTTTKPAPVPERDYDARQMKLFGTFYAAGTGKPDDQLSNAIAWLDLLPRFCVTRARMNSKRTAEGHLPPIDHEVTIDGASFRVRIWPAQVEVKVDGAVKWQSFYPSAREELVEHALRKIATLQRKGFYGQTAPGSRHLPALRTGVRFTLNQLCEELKRQGHSMTHSDLVQSLDILSLSSIEITPIHGEGKKPEFVRANYLPALGSRTRQEYRERGRSDEESTWLAEFHPILATAIASIGYRQTNYSLFMSLKKQIQRYLYMRLVLKFTQASMLTTYDIRFSTIRDDSCIFKERTQLRDCTAEVEDAWGKLKEVGVITRYEVTYDRGPKNAIVDAKYKVIAAQSFINEQKAANRRRNDFLAEGGVIGSSRVIRYAGSDAARADRYRASDPVQGG